VNSHPAILFIFVIAVVALVVIPMLIELFRELKVVLCTRRTEDSQLKIANARSRCLSLLLFLVHLILPVTDSITEAVYILHAPFYSKELFIATASLYLFASFIGPAVELAFRLVLLKACPKINRIQNRWIWLCFAQYNYKNHPYVCDGDHWNWAPHYYVDTWTGITEPYLEVDANEENDVRLVRNHRGRKLCFLATVDHIAPPAAMLNFILVIFYVTLQVISIPIVMIIYLLKVFGVSLLYLLGIFVIWTKADSMGPIWSMWMKAWTWTDSFAAEFESPEMVIDTELFNSYMIFHCMFQSLPHLILQLSNDILIRSTWGWFSFVSFGVSGYLMLAGGYTFLIHLSCGRCGYRVSTVKDVPQILSFIGLKMLSLQPASKVKPKRRWRRRGVDGDTSALMDLEGGCQDDSGFEVEENDGVEAVEELGNISTGWDFESKNDSRFSSGNTIESGYVVMGNMPLILDEPPPCALSSSSPLDHPIPVESSVTFVSEIYPLIKRQNESKIEEAEAVGSDNMEERVQCSLQPSRGGSQNHYSEVQCNTKGEGASVSGGVAPDDGLGYDGAVQSDLSVGVMGGASVTGGVAPDDEEGYDGAVQSDLRVGVEGGASVSGGVVPDDGVVYDGAVQSDVKGTSVTGRETED